MQMLFSGARPSRLRSMLQFAEAEIVVPSGPFEGMRFSVARQPFARLWFNAIDDVHRPSDHFSEMIITGPSQSGKTLIGFVIPIMYHLFERQETVVAAVPDLDMARDKWEQDIEPVLGRTRYRELLPRKNFSFRGGDSITFRNGRILRFMSAGGSDKSRAGFTTRVVCMTETDGFDTRTSTSDEATKIEQIEARTRSYPIQKRRIYKECTPSTDVGHTWVRYMAGTASKIWLPCRHCKKWVFPERESLHGWQEAETDFDALQSTSFFCPKCGEAWVEEDRRWSNTNAKLIHRGQEISEQGEVTGEAVKTLTLGFRWSAVNNMLVPAADVGVDEWRAVRAEDEDNEERKLCQFVWALPYRPKSEYRVRLDVDKLNKRQSRYGRGQAPAETSLVTVGVDVNIRVLHWTAIAWDKRGRGFVIDYGTQGVESDDAVFAEAIREALLNLDAKLGSGWTRREVDRIGVDCRWETDAVVQAIRSFRSPKWRCFMGLGAGHWARNKAVPVKVSGDVIWVGDQCYEKVVQKHRSTVIFADANYWKTWLHKRLAITQGEKEDPSDGVITLFETTNSKEHVTFAKHLTAEREVQTFEPGKGYLKIWEPIRPQNHWLDSTYIACVLYDRYKNSQRPQVMQSRAVNQVGDDHSFGFAAPQFTIERSF